eukprot:CAMPEP_0195034548 /NCGR_PEP_ID=MMETSP0326_2-20130528/68105_1 /TAXON_ID=2866 ORGANISM="Crypthecodinium cohnii, Strain Seligo" /NCGR_SAMPLE_ID=MMETSP0326_2 /ASSEMBLY_ACC=CAM_ASM_000348 /LENGTH=44 /DNA_ID= /DNA_START= /DNA_END= /DNA_ORIENTATION=
MASRRLDFQIASRQQDFECASHVRVPGDLQSEDHPSGMQGVKST